MHTRGKGLSARSVAAATVMTLLTISACADEAVERVRVCGDLVVPDDIGALRVIALDDQLQELVGGVLVLDDADGNETLQLPVVVDLERHDKRRVIRVQALRDDVEVARGEVHVDAAIDPVVVNLRRSCLGQVCPRGQTCIDVACTVTPNATDPRIRCDTPAGAP